MNNAKQNYCLLLAGGIGKRLWPYSTSECPKQFIDVFGTGRTLLQETFERVSRIIPPENIYISTFDKYVHLVREQLPQIGESQILAEPVQLSTAPATAWATIHISLFDPTANLLVTPCDQLVLNTAQYVADISDALEYASTSPHLIALGVPADTPNTAYGYVQTGDNLTDSLYTIRTFLEKPDKEYAKTFVDSGEFLWNTGLFAWNVQAFLKQLPVLMPVLQESIDAATQDLKNGRELQLVKTLYPTNVRGSIDLTVLSHVETALIKRCNFGWADIGSWPQIKQTIAPQPDSNVAMADSQVVFNNAQGNLVFTPKEQLTVVEGLNDIIVVQKNNVLLVCPNTDPALVKTLYKDINSRLGGEYV